MYLLLKTQQLIKSMLIQVRIILGLNPGSVYIIRDGMTSVYHGYRSWETLLSFFKNVSIKI